LVHAKPSKSVFAVSGCSWTANAIYLEDNIFRMTLHSGGFGFSRMLLWRLAGAALHTDSFANQQPRIICILFIDASQRIPEPIWRHLKTRSSRAFVARSNIVGRSDRMLPRERGERRACPDSETRSAVELKLKAPRMNRGGSFTAGAERGATCMITRVACLEVLAARSILSHSAQLRRGERRGFFF
jgi:hypothetical protein